MTSEAKIAQLEYRIKKLEDMAAYVQSYGNIKLNQPNLNTGVVSNGLAMQIRTSIVNLLVPTHTPVNSTDTGNDGDFTWDAGYLYHHVNNTWRRVATSTF